MADDATTPPTEPDGTTEDTPATEPVTTTKPTTDDLVTARLTELGVDAAVIARIKDELGVATIDDLVLLTEQDLTGVGMPVVKARRLLQEITPVVTPTVPDATTIGAAALDILPGVQDDPSWLASLKAGGVLRVDESSIVAVVRAALASRAGLFDLRKRLIDLMETHADSIDEQVDAAVFYPLRKQLARTSYAEVFEAVDGLDGTFVTDARKRQLLGRVDQYLWPAIMSFNDQMRSWQEDWLQGASPQLMMTAFLGAGSGLALPPGMMQPPDTGVLRDHADAVKDAINRVFGGTGVQIAAALAYEATQIRTTLENRSLPALIGAANRDQMLRQLGVAVNATYPRLETNLVRFVLAILNIDSIPAGAEELQYFGALYMLGSQIDWAQLGGRGTGAITGLGGNVLDPSRIGRTAIGGAAYDAGYSPDGEPLKGGTRRRPGHVEEIPGGWSPEARNR